MKILRTGLSDTDPETEKVHISLLRNASISQRLSRVRSLSKTVMILSWRAIARANPGLTDQAIDILFVAHHYGQDLADRLKNYLDQKPS